MMVPQEEVQYCTHHDGAARLSGPWGVLLNHNLSYMYVLGECRNRKVACVKRCAQCGMHVVLHARWGDAKYPGEGPIGTSNRCRCRV